MNLKLRKRIDQHKNKDDECFRWCHIRHLNPQKKDPQRNKRDDKQYVDKLNYNGITFPLSQKQYQKIEKQNSIKINVFGYEERQPYPIHISKETFEDQMNLPQSPIDHKGRKETLHSNKGLQQVHVQPIKAPTS